MSIGGDSKFILGDLGNVAGGDRWSNLHSRRL